ECYYVERIRRSGKTNLCFEKTYINPKVCPNIIDFITPNASLYKLYEEKYNLKLSEGQYNLEAINASSSIAKTLDIPEGSAVLYMEANIFLYDNTPLYFVEAYYIGSRYTFSTTLKR
ncbi:MAG: UTRA domain-containing protein, partial [Candidatus Izemoplasmatales bacterium]